MKFLPITLLALAGLVEASQPAKPIRLNSADFRALRKLDQEAAADDGADDAADAADDGADAADEAAADESSSSSSSSATPYWPEQTMATAGALEFIGCHTFITGEGEVANKDGNNNRNNYNGQYQNNYNAQYQYGQNANGEQEDAVADYQTKSYVILGGNFASNAQSANANGNQFYYEDNENEASMQKAAMEITDFMTTVVTAAENQRYGDCKICASLQYYCFPPEKENLYSGGSTHLFDDNGNVVAQVTWDAAWDWSKSEQQNMGAYYGLEDAVSCNDCVAKNCYPYEDYANMWEYLAQNVYAVDFDTFSQYAFKEVYQKYADMNGGEYPGEFSDLENMFDTLDEMLEAIPECTQVEGTNYYAGWTCTSSGNGIQRGVFTDNECTEYVKVNYEDIAMNDADGFAAFSYAMTNLDISGVLTDGLTCDSSHLTVGSGIAERYGYDMYGQQLDYDTYMAEREAAYANDANYNGNNNGNGNNNVQYNFGYFTNPQINEMCYDYKYKQLEGQIDISVCDAYSSYSVNGYNANNNAADENADGENQQYNANGNGNVNQYYANNYANQEFEAELDADDLEDGNLQAFCDLISNEFGTAKGNQETQDSSIAYTPKETSESGFAALNPGVKGVIWAIVVLVAVVFAVAIAITVNANIKKGSDAPEFKEPLSPEGTAYVAA